MAQALAILAAFPMTFKVPIANRSIRVLWSSNHDSSSSSITTEVTSTNSSKLLPVNAVSKPAKTRLSDAEKHGRYLRGECFRCGDKYGPGHRCKTGTFKLLELEDEGGELTENSQDCIDGLAKISFHALFGKSALTTMKLQGILGTAEVLILIDSGSTHNFISDKLVCDMKLIPHFISPFGVQIGNGDILRCNQICKNISLQLLDLKISQDFYPFALGGADVVLGIQWLATLDTVQANWKEMFLKFTIEGKEYKLEGLPPHLQQPATFSHFAIEPFNLYASQAGAIDKEKKVDNFNAMSVVSMYAPIWFHVNNNSASFNKQGLDVDCGDYK
ncbi:hypothetical protein E3N88_22032 [Mikania micrantha]|uniref:Uncharacterized protein n=1 Tax=Mikania micrantha TaxID=192012 RepID=A0A5N6N9B5_9ASTR|nr:hypothetical protein E3N88_22032 [Mikania micrantha]